MLDERKSAILRTVVQRYIETAQPVGSAQVVESTDVGVSPATVRNEMHLLERDGYLVQPHTSAGRVPTEKAYRFFVDSLGGPAELGPAQVRQVRAFFDHAHGELEGMLKDTSRLLAQLTATTAVVVGEPPEPSATVRSVQLVGLGSRLVLAVAVLSNGLIVKATVEPEHELDDDDLARASQTLSRHLDGTAGSAPPPAPLGEARLDAIVQRAASALRDAVAAEAPRVFVEGASHIAGAFGAADTLREVLGLLEQQLAVVTLLRDVMDRGLSVAIGSETGVAPLSECSIVVAPFMAGGERAGTIGVLGPTRMNYPDTLAAVAVVSERLTRALTEGE